ncbi:unnamed protein product [Closterium sp. NIES-64]|nr:unnamed protein product [Closterium sp. NIES-65]CAI5994878.1 unnamed protein product [Closterium sp. NIES-64]
MSTSAGDGGEIAARSTTISGGGGGGGGGGGDSDASCWYSRVERRQCRVVHDEDGRPVKECERTREVLRQCAGGTPPTLNPLVLLASPLAPRWLSPPLATRGPPLSPGHDSRSRAASLGGSHQVRHEQTNGFPRLGRR